MSFDSATNVGQLQNYLDRWILDKPISHWGGARLEKPFSLALYEDWLLKGYHGKMEYLAEHLPMKAEPQLLGAQLRSAIVFAFPYLPHPETADYPLRALSVALYARGEDYHFWIKKHLHALIVNLKELYPGEEFMAFTDSAPVLERDLAARAGLGWVGKNSCVLDRTRGSLFLIGEIFTSLQLDVKLALQPDFCGTCTACIEVCPTQALKAPRVLDANLCISYWTIESREVPPKELRPAFGDLFFGCDLCQTVCPWNKKVFKAELLAESRKPDRPAQIAELRTILTSSGKSLSRHFKGTALLRAGPFGLRRNALIVIANMKFYELKKDVEVFLADEKLGELACWTMEQLAPPAD